jgi:hypothetical protein
MDISNISANGAVSAALATQQAATQGEVQTAVFKKALDTQTQNALMLIDAIPKPPSNQGLPPNLGNNVNTSV